MSTSNMSIGRGWTVVTSDGKRVGDVTEVHPHYLLVSKGVVLVRDLYLPLGTVDRTEGNRVILGLTYQTLRGMNLKHEPPPLPPAEPEPLHDPAPVDYSATTYDAGTGAYDPGTATYDSAAVGQGDDTSYAWGGDTSQDYDEVPSYTRPQPNGLVEVETGLNLAFQDLGYGQAIVLVPGWPFDSTVWEPLPTILAEDHRVIAYDPRGTGGSDRPWDFYSVELLATDLHRLIVEESLHDVTIVAWSTAALVAMLYAQEHSRRVARLILLNPLLPLWLTDPALTAELQLHSDLDAATQELWATELLADRPAQHERLIDHLTAAPLSGARRHWLWQRLMLGAPHAQLKTWEALRTFDPQFVIPQVQAPVTIISGENDRLSPPALAAHLAGLLPRAQSVVIGDCGHASFLEQRDAVVQAIADLVRVIDETTSDATGDTAADTVEDTIPETIAETAPDAIADTVLQAAGDAVPDTIGDTAPEAIDDAAPASIDAATPAAVTAAGERPHDEAYSPDGSMGAPQPAPEQTGTAPEPRDLVPDQPQAVPETGSEVR